MAGRGPRTRRYGFWAAQVFSLKPGNGSWKRKGSEMSFSRRRQRVIWASKSWFVRATGSCGEKSPKHPAEAYKNIVKPPGPKAHSMGARTPEGLVSAAETGSPLKQGEWDALPANGAASLSPREGRAGRELERGAPPLPGPLLHSVEE